MRTSPVLLVSIVATVAPSPALGQSVESIRQGARVRVEIEGKRRTGILAERGRDTLRIRMSQADTMLAVPLARVERLEVSRERQSDAGRGALVGFVIGAVPGVIAGATCDCGNHGAAILGLGALTGGLGAAIGAGIGATSHHDVWEVVPLATEVTFSSPALGIAAVLRPRLR